MYNRIAFVVWYNRMTQEFMTDPLHIRFGSVSGQSLISAASRAASGALSLGDETKEIKIMFIGECGGGQTREIRWSVSGDVQDFYAPGSTFVVVNKSEDEQNPACPSDISNSSTAKELADEMMDVEARSREAKEPIVELPEWKFEYYLMGGAGMMWYAPASKCDHVLIFC